MKHAKYSNTVILVSDLHYTVENKNAKGNPSLAAGDNFGYTQAEKIELALTDIQDFQDAQEVNAVLVLGDLSLDDCGCRNLETNYVKRFKADFMDKLTCPSYALAGNHDNYTDEEWKKVFGYPRQYSFKIGDVVFMMLDTFAYKSENVEPNGSDYVGIDMAWLADELQKYPTEKVFLCSHYFKRNDFENTYSEKFKKLLNENPRIVCLFDAHTHRSCINTPAVSGVLQSKVNIGGYGYNGLEVEKGVWDFNVYQVGYEWGYQVLQWDENEIHTYHVKPTRQYLDSRTNKWIVFEKTIVEQF